MSVFDNDNELIAKLAADGNSLSVIQKKRLASLLLDNHTYISSKTVKKLVAEDYIRISINGIVPVST